MSVLIVGGGAAGGAAACLLGPEAVLLEREPGAHDKICGEFVSAEAAHYLRLLGLHPEALGATTIGAVRLVHGARMATARLPFPAFGLSRRVLDAALLERAAARGATVLRGHAVRSLEDGVAEAPGLGRFTGHDVFLATGKHELRGSKRRLVRPPENLVGLKMYLRLDPAQARELAGHVEIILFGRGYAGLQIVEDGAANLCLLLDRDRFLAAGQGWAGVQQLLEIESPHLARRLRGAATLLARPLTIFRVPYGHVHLAQADEPPSVYRLGDQFGVIPSFSGDGVSIALHTAFAAVAARQAADARRYHRELRRQIGPQIGRAGLIYRLGRAAPAWLTAAATACPAALRWAATLTRVPRLATGAAGPHATYGWPDARVPGAAD